MLVKGNVIVFIAFIIFYNEPKNQDIKKVPTLYEQIQFYKPNECFTE